LRQFLVADRIEVGVGAEIIAAVDRARATECALVLAEDLRGVQTLSQGPLFFELSEQLLAGVVGRGGNCQAQRRNIFDFEGFRVVYLRGNGDDLVVFVEVEEFELLWQ